jgi:hypothetical protein
MKKFAYFAAASFLVIAQAASAKPGPGPTTLPSTSQGQPGQVVTNVRRTVIIRAVDTGSLPGKATLTDGTVWTLPGIPNNLTVAGVVVAPGALKAGMRCVMIGHRSSTSDYMGNLACE